MNPTVQLIQHKRIRLTKMILVWTTLYCTLWTLSKCYATGYIHVELRMANFAFAESSMYYYAPRVVSGLVKPEGPYHVPLTNEFQ